MGMPKGLVLSELEEIQLFLSIPSCVTLSPYPGHQMTGLYPSEVVRSASGQKIQYANCAALGVNMFELVILWLIYFAVSELCFTCLAEVGFGLKCIFVCCSDATEALL